MVAPWTRDATVRAYVVTLAPEVAGRIVQLHTVDNQFVHKGDLLMVVDPTDYRSAFQLASAVVQQAEATSENARQQADRQRKLSDLAVTVEDRQAHEASALETDAQRQQAVAQREQAKINLERTEIRPPVNGCRRHDRDCSRATSAAEASPRSDKSVEASSLARSSGDIVALVEPFELWVVGVIFASACTLTRSLAEWRRSPA